MSKKFRRYGLIAGLLFIFATQGAIAQNSDKEQNKIPNPAHFLTPETVALTVVHARPDDEGFRSLFDTAWNALSGASGIGSNYVYATILRLIQGNESNAFSGLLPAQFIRVDSLVEGSNEPHPTTISTLSDWYGLQVAWYKFQGRNKKGEENPKIELDEATLTLREGYEDPSLGRVLTWLDGTVMSFPSVERAKFAIDRYSNGITESPNPEFGELLAGIDTTHDTYGVLLNRNGSALKQLRWLNKHDVGRAEEKVGKERMARIMDNVLSMTWEGDLVSDNECKFIVKFRSKTAEDRKELTTMLREVRSVLDDYGRAGTMETTGLDNELFVDFEMVGYRRMLEGYIHRSF